MGLPVTVYRWDDVGAPPLGNGTPLEIITILKQCLVSGYGTKEPLGWSILFEDTSTRQIILKNDDTKGGSGGCVKVKSYNGSNNPNGMMWYQPARSASDINNMLGVGNIHSVSTNDKELWFLIGTSMGFYFVTGTTLYPMAGWVNDHERSVYCGDFISSDVNDAGRFIAVSMFNTNTTTTAGITTASWPNIFGTMRMSAGAKLLSLYDTDGGLAASSSYTIESGYGAMGTVKMTQGDSPIADLYTRYWVKLYGYTTSNLLTQIDRVGVFQDSCRLNC
jgi:hypothetical protein